MTRSGKGPFVEPGPQLQSIKIIFKVMIMMIVKCIIMIMRIMKYHIHDHYTNHEASFVQNHEDVDDDHEGSLS